MSDPDTNPPPDWIPPTVEELHALLPQYEISAVLGRGGMGAVYKGCQTKLKRDIAIKILPESLGDEGEHLQFVERFKLEAQSMANLNHPAIVSVYDFGETSDGQLYLVMEFIDGMDIEAYLHHHGGKLVHEHAIAITAHVLDALQYAHDHGVVHRDIKPANVLINSEGRVKIADFGLAKRLTESEDEPDTGLTSANVVMGTPDFVAPEALEIGSNPDGRADLYSVGVMFYQMLTGKLPRGQFELPSVLNPVLDPRFDAVVSRALQANPDSRYGSASEFRIDLDGLLTKPVPKASDTQPAKIPAAPLRTKVPVQSSVPYPKPKLAERKKSKAPLVVGLALGTALVIGVGIFAMKRSNSGEEPEVVRVEPQQKPTPKPAPVPPTPPKPLVDTTPPPPVSASADPVMPPDEDKKDDPPVVPSPEPIPEPRVDLAAIPGLQSRLETYLDLRREQVGRLAGNYLGGLETRLSQAASAGDLKLARAYEAEKARVADLRRTLGEPPADPFSAVEQAATLPALPTDTPEGVTALRLTWTAERQKIRDDLDGKLSLSLQALEVELTKARALDQAEDVLAFRDSLNIPRPAKSSAISPRFEGNRAGQEIVNALGMKLCWIPAGRFTKGSPEDEAGRQSDEAQVDVELRRGFWMGKYEVTQEEYEEVMGTNPAKFKEVGKRKPVEQVNWARAMNFCKELTEQERKMGRLPEGWTYTLPTEAQWEYACRAGEKGPYSGGKPDEVAWHKGNSRGTTHPVGEKLANPWGLHDMHGNVFEWCQDWYDSSYPGGVLIDPQGPATGPGRVLRGGNWRASAVGTRCANRIHANPRITLFSFGFRVVLAPSAGSAEPSPKPPPATAPAASGSPLSEASGLAGSTAGEERENSIGMKLCWIPAGKFTMGSPEDEAGRKPDEAQVDVVLTRGFWMGKYEVTQEEFEEITGINPAQFKESGKRAPVEMVSWNAAMDFCEKLTVWERKQDRLSEGWTYTLPTEAQWEYACRAGETGMYSGGELDEVGWYDGNADGKTHEVGQKKGNAWGLYDMHGNVREWGSDWWAELLSGGIDPGGPATVAKRVCRGGSWYRDAGFARCANRSGDFPNITRNFFGFRVVLVPSAESSPRPPKSVMASSGLTNPGSATKAEPFNNSLGMKFVPVPITGGQRVLFSIWETRVSDYAAFLKDDRDRPWPKPDWEQKNDHPAVNVSWEDAVAFCEWLTEEERKTGKLGKDELYRLPTDHEWSCAVGIGKDEDVELLPSAKNQKLADVFPWGRDWPPLNGAGNYYGGETAQNPVSAKPPIERYDDAHDRTSPVGSYQANEYGIYDLGGNAWEWCEDWFDPAKKNRRVLRGAAWVINEKGLLRSFHRGFLSPAVRNNSVGVRLVIESK